MKKMVRFLTVLISMMGIVMIMYSVLLYEAVLHQRRIAALIILYALGYR